MKARYLACVFYFTTDWNSGDVSRLQDITSAARESGRSAGTPALSRYALANGNTSVTRDILT